MCSDGPDYDETTTQDMFDRVVEARNMSETLGTMWPTDGGWPCHHWQIRAVESVTNFSAKQKHPILILSNEYDPVRAIENGHKILEKSLAKGDAGLGIREGYGHCTYSLKPSCSTKATQPYMANWTLPEDSMISCPVDEDLFPQTYLNPQ
ncbi:hypothetical protein FIBSPDRAFT_567283 [Athelia psychrophila]|uniref:Peptidase S33 tripeptidyl aminopeptidase-like C-terminal domain-containing protein n=1 Tax=Athelia psychrophila TaxID=1759441 RepID=A0A166I084_9AGAM|nr:hypothetical protein FIBSPDRAFT_567283 [Fibularhizoctonia sp. CBS 109695]